MIRQVPNHRISISYVCLLLTLFSLTTAEAGELKHLFDLTHAAGTPLALPSDVVVAKDGKIFVVDGGNHRVVVFKKNGKFFRSIGAKGSDDGLFSNPVGIGIDAKDRVYVADRGNHRIQLFDSKGKLQRIFPINVGGKKIRPIDVAVSPKDGTIYVTGNNNHSIMVYSPSGKLISTWGGQGSNPGEFRYPATLIVTRDNVIGVVDVLNSRVQLFEPEGKLLTTVGSWGVLPGQLFRPKGIAVDLKEQFYISDSYMEVIEVFDNKTRFLHVLGGKEQVHKFISPAGIAVDDRNRLYVAEMLANKVSVYKLEP